MARITEHRNAHLSTDNMHEVKGFPNASNGYSYRKGINGLSSWLRDKQQPNVLGRINGYEAPTTEVDGDIYTIESPELDILRFTWVSANTVKVEFSLSPDLSIYTTGSYLQITGEDSQPVHNGAWIITTINNGSNYIEVTNIGVSDNTNDVGVSAGFAYVTHEDFDPESLSNNQSIPRIGLVKYYGTSDLWFGNELEEGDSFYNESTKTLETYSANGFLSDSFSFVSHKNDLPTASSGVITLATGTTYYIVASIDLTGDRLNCEGVTSIIGSSPEVASIKSTGLAAGTNLLTSEFTISLRNVTLEHASIISLDATANAGQVIDWYGVNFSNATTAIGLVKNYDNTILNTLGFLNSGGLTFDGSIGTIAFTDTLFENATTLTSIILPSTLTVTRRFRINNSSFVSLSGETALNVSASATIPDEGYILSNVNFGGGGTYLTGVQSTDNKARFEGCRGISNSGNIGQYYMQGNATVTTISSSGTFVKIAGTTTTGTYVEKFDVTTTSNKGVYSGSLTGFYKVEIVAGCTSGNSKELELAIYKNGVITTPSRSKGTTTGSGKAENIVSHDILELSTNDYVEAFITNNTGTTNITVEDLNVTIVRLN